MILFDNHNRPLTYLRLAVTDRCNLRCTYCMPQEKMQYLPKKEVLTFEEIERLVSLLAAMGISKVRITGGEPFVRNDVMKLLKAIRQISGIEEVHITTNGVLTAPHVPALKSLGITSVNLSLDSLDTKRFFEITRRDELHVVLKTLDLLLEHGIPVKVNAVVMEGKNIEDIVPLVNLTRNANINVRFIEEMPFNGKDGRIVSSWNYLKIRSYIEGHYGTLEKLHDEPFSTSQNFKVPGFKGSVGIIAAYTRTFCGTCNRIRITSQGQLKTCLYDGGVLDVKQLLRSGATDTAIQEMLLLAFKRRPLDGFEAEQAKKQRTFESMSVIGG